MVPGNPVSSRGCNSFSPFDEKRKGTWGEGAWRWALQWELSVRSWDESATQRKKRRGEKTHICLDRTKAYKCVRIRPRGIASFARFKKNPKKRGESFELWRLCTAPSHLLVYAVTEDRKTEKQTAYMLGNHTEDGGLFGLFMCTRINQQNSLHRKSWCVSMLCMSA